MAAHDPRVDAYIARQAAFARPILERARATVHEACPEVEETVKWSMPSFVYAGGILCTMAAFKQHAAFGFWKHALVMGQEGAQGGPPRDGMGSFGKMTALKDLPPKKQFIALVRKAMALNEQGVKTPGARKAIPNPPPVAPPDLTVALKKNRKAKATRQKRLLQAVEWLAEGKPRNWKYADC